MGLGLCGDLEGWDEAWVVGKKVQQGGSICIHIADSFHCIEKTNSIVKQLYSNKKKKIYSASDHLLALSDCIHRKENVDLLFE